MTNPPAIRFSDPFQAAIRQLRTPPEPPPEPLPRPATPIMLPDTSLTQRIQWVIGQIPAGARVLDLGCGRGEMLHHLVRVRGVEHLGLEREPEFLERCRSLGLNVLPADFNNLADPALRQGCSQRWDVALAIDTLGYWRCPAAVLAALHGRVGRIFVTVNNAAHFHHRWQLLLGREGELPNTRGVRADGTAEFSPDWFSHRWTPEGFTRWAQALGYEVTPLARRSVSAKYVPLGLFPEMFARSILYELRPRPDGLAACA